MTYEIVKYNSKGSQGHLWIPENPIGAIIFWHGNDEKASFGGVNLVLKHGPPKLYAAGYQSPFILFAPQCTQGGWYVENVTEAIKYFDEVCKRFGVTQRHCTGLSMGGHATYDCARWSYQNGFPIGFFKTYGVVCGWGDAMINDPRPYQGTKWKLWHGTEDKTITYDRGVKLYENLKKILPDTEFVKLDGVKHDAWTYAYNVNRPDNYFKFIEENTSVTTPEETIAVLKAHVNDLTAQVGALTAETTTLKGKITQIVNIASK